jgi:ribosome recycling factor
MVDEALQQAEHKMQKAVEVAREEFGGVRTGRASPQLLQRLTVDYYGTQTPMQQLASFSVPEPRLLVIHPYDRNAMQMIEKAIMSSDLGLNPSNDGSVIRLAFPTLTEERRKELVKVIKDRAEHGRVAVRAVRRHTKEEIDKEMKDGKVSEDQGHRAEKELQKLTDRFVAEIDAMLERKESELMEV